CLDDLGKGAVVVPVAVRGDDCAHVRVADQRAQRLRFGGRVDEQGLPAGGVAEQVGVVRHLADRHLADDQAGQLADVGRLARFALPLAGVPIAVKDNVPVAGEVMTVGNAARASAAPETRDHKIVTRLRKAGAVVIGITRVPELCLYAATDAPGTVTRNPWD